MGAVFHASAPTAKAMTLNTSGRLHRAYQSVFCRDDKKLSRNLSARPPNQSPGLFYRDLLGKSLFHHSGCRMGDPLLRAGEGDCFIVMRFELTDLLVLLKIRRDRLAASAPISRNA